MPAIAQCPKCHEQVSLPQNVARLARVRCPLCDEAYLLEEALKNAPPELIVLDASSVETAATADATSEPEAWQTSVDDSVDLELESIEAFVPLGGVKFSDTHLEPVAVTEPQLDDTKVVTATIPLLPPRRRGPSVFRQIFGIVAGGVFGLTLGYGVLLWIGGPNKDFLQIAQHVPPVLLPKSFHPDVPLPAKPAAPVDPGPKEQVEAPESNDAPLAEDKPDEPRPEPDAIPTSLEDPLPAPQISADPPDANKAPALPLPEPPQPKPLPPTVLNTKSFSADELGDALRSASEAKKDLLRGTLKTVEGKRAKAGAYRTMCRLAEAYTFVAEDDSTPPTLDARKLAVRELMLQIADSQSKVAELDTIASQWLRARTRDSGGIVFVGTVERTELPPPGAKEIYTTRIRLVNRPEPLTVLGRHQPDWQTGDTVLVLGSLVDEPAKNIAGYSDDAPQVIWAGLLVKISMR